VSSRSQRHRVDVAVGPDAAQRVEGGRVLFAQFGPHPRQRARQDPVALGRPVESSEIQRQIDTHRERRRVVPAQYPLRPGQRIGVTLVRLFEPAEGLRVAGEVGGARQRHRVIRTERPGYAGRRPRAHR
jgi:hypothetical protein